MEVYLDNSATTKCYESVREIVGKVMCEDYGNPSSMHKKGSRCRKIYKRVKRDIGEAFKSAGERDLLYFRRDRE